MIRAVMLGRLGNNLFQYAFARTLAEHHGVPMLLSGAWFNRATWRYVEPLRMLPAFANGRSRLTRAHSIPARLLRKIVGKHPWELMGKPVIREREGDHSHDPRLVEAPSDCVLFGYFQSHHYFQSIEPIIRAELRTNDLGLERGHERDAEKLCDASSVAIHVRRTDYLQNRNLACCSETYYRQAMRQMRKRIGNPHFHIFSDDPKWCAATFTDDDCEVAGCGDPFRPLVDLHLMSLAGHHIIANSSFSWWAAWLGKKPGQQVIMPDVWFHSGIHAPIHEKQCDGWIIIENGIREGDT